jgi:hypothetical protein
MFTKSFRCVVVVLFGLLPVKCIDGQTAPQKWAAKSFHDKGDRDAPYVLQLEMVSERDPLIGKFVFERPQYRKQTTNSPFVIEGHRGQDGTFWPNVQLEVKTEPDGKWLKVASSLDAAVSARLSVYHGMVAYGLFVDLQPFEAYIGNYNYGRVLLRSGEDRVINLKDLVNVRSSGEAKKLD